MSIGTKIAKNTSVFLISQIISYVIGFLYTIYMARYLGPENFGILTFAISLTSLLAIFTDMGFNTLMTREIARDKSLSSKYLSNFISMKIILVSVIFIITISIINSLDYPKETVYVIYLLMFNLILTTVSGAFYSLFQAYEELKYQSLIIFLSSVLMLIGVFAAINYQASVVGFAAIYLVISLFSLIYSLLVVYRTFELPKIDIDWKFWKDNIKLALPFGLIGIFATIYVYIDSSMLFFMQGGEAVGIYGASYRLVLVLLFIPSAINAAIFPVMSRLYSSSEHSLKKIVAKYFKYMIFIGIPMAVVGTILADKIILFLYGTGYTKSVIVFQILIWATTFTFANAAFVQLFQSINKELLMTKITGVFMVINVVLNLILIPKYSYIGASVNTLITEFGIAILLILIYSKSRYFIGKNQILATLFKIVLASTITGIFTLIFRGLNLIILIMLSTALYIFISYITNGIDAEDKKLIKNLVK